MIGWLCGDKVTVEGHASLCSEMTAPCRGSGPFTVKSSVVGEHQSVCQSTKSTAVPTVSSVLTQLGLSHTSHTAGQIACTLICFFDSFSQNQGKRSPSAGCERLKQRGKALQSSEWITSACRFNTRHFEMAVTAAL